MRVYIEVARRAFRQQLAYRTANLAGLATNAFWGALRSFLFLALFRGREVAAGWRAGEVALLYGLAMVAFGLSEMVAAGFDVFPRAIQQGEFDRVLLRPVGIFVQVLAADFQLRRLGRTAQGGLALALAMAWTPIVWTPLKVLYLLVVLVSGFVMFSALLVLGAVLCFWTVQSIEIINTVTYGGTEMASYPLPIYHDLLQRFFTFVVPLAFVSYFPALYLLDRPELQRLPSWLPGATPLAAALLALTAWLAWRVGVRHYQSTGS